MYVISRILIALIAIFLSLPSEANRMKVHHALLAKVTPRFNKNHMPSAQAAKSMARTIEFYEHCMYDETDDRIQYAISLNMKWRENPGLRGSPEKLGYEVCLTDVLGLPRFDNQKQIDAAKGTDLLMVSAEFILFPDDDGNTVPPERQFARPWAKNYIEGIARDLHEYLLRVLPRGNKGPDVPPLRMGSLVRSLESQKQLPSTANCATKICSTHLFGLSMDISNHPNYVPKIVRDWIKQRLVEDRRLGKIVMIQEFVHPHFHVLVVPPVYVE